MQKYQPGESELKWVLEGAELECYHFIEEVYVKWEAREVKLIMELEEKRVLHTANPMLSDKAPEQLKPLQ